MMKNASMLLQNLGQKAALRFYAFQMRSRNRRPTLDMCGYMKQAKKVLVCLPVEKDGFDVAVDCIDEFRQIFSASQITLFVAKENPLPADVTSHFRVLSYDANDFRPFGLLKRGLRNDLRANGFDVVVDLSRDFNFVATSAAWTCEAKLCVCFSHPQRDAFYNFVLRLEPNQNWDKAFKTLFHYLGHKTSPKAI